MDQELARIVAHGISRGHAFQVHVIEGEEFPEISTRDEFAAMIERVLVDSTSVQRPLREGRQAFWNDALLMLVIVDRFHEDGGTAFRPTRGKAYFLGLR
jgi:filamentous hemagglutinin